MSSHPASEKNEEKKNENRISTEIQYHPLPFTTTTHRRERIIKKKANKLCVQTLITLKTLKNNLMKLPHFRIIHTYMHKYIPKTIKRTKNGETIQKIIIKALNTIYTHIHNKNCLLLR